MKKPITPFPTMPGEMLEEEFLKPLNMSQTDLARKLKVQPRAINEICRGKRSISPRMAFLLAEAFDTTPEIWMNLQTSWDLWKEWEKLTKKKKAS